MFLSFACRCLRRRCHLPLFGLFVVQVYAARVAMGLRLAKRIARQVPVEEVRIVLGLLWTSSRLRDKGVCIWTWRFGLMLGLGTKT